MIYSSIPTILTPDIISNAQLETADTHIDRASGTIKGMIRQYARSSPHSRLTDRLSNHFRMYKQRIILSGLGVFFVVLILTILYFKLVR